MTPQEFITAAIEGGWKTTGGSTLGEILLDPSAWKAVGKARGYPNGTEMYIPLWVYERNGARGRHHRFIDFLHDGLSLVDALKESTK